MGTQDFRDHYDDDENDGPFWSNQRCRGCGAQRDQDESVFCLDCHAKGRRLGEQPVPRKEKTRFSSLV